TEIARYLATAVSSPAPFLEFSRQQLEITLGHWQCHAEGTCRLLLAFLAVKKHERQRFSNELVAHGTALTATRHREGRFVQGQSSFRSALIASCRQKIRSSNDVTTYPITPPYVSLFIIGLVGALF